METCSAAHPRCARHGRAPCSLPQITGPLREEPNHHHLNTSTTTTTRSPPFPLRRSLQTLDPLPRRRYAVRGDPARRRGCRPYRRSSGASAPTESSGGAAQRPCPTRPSARSTTSRLRSAPPPPRLAPQVLLQRHRRRLRGIPLPRRLLCRRPPADGGGEAPLR
jgi:hypothetical protein